VPKAKEDKEDKVFIKYTAFPGVVSERSITKDEFKVMGIEQETVSFNRDNRYMVDASDLPEDVIKVFSEDNDFSVGVSDRAPRLMTGEKYDADSEAGPVAAPAGEGSISDTAGTGTTETGNTSIAGSSGGSTPPTT
jgi:hypothetical protein